MEEILLFAGTTEGRKLSEYLAEAGIRHTVCVATEYGEEALKKNPLVTVRRGRMDEEEIKKLIQTGRFAAVADATHPYAENITCNIRAALKRAAMDKSAGEKALMQGNELPYLRLKRENASYDDGCRNSVQTVYFNNKEDCAEALKKVNGNILLTTGSKDLSDYCISEEVKGRLYVRVLPALESISLCMQQGIRGKQIIAMQGPFTAEMNAAMIRQYGIACLVTKESGISGGFLEKLEAAERTGIQAFVVGRPREEEGLSFSEVCSELEKICGRRFHLKERLRVTFAGDDKGEKKEVLKPDFVGSGRDEKKKQLEISLAGIGMGHVNSLTKEVWDIVENADILLGAERMLTHSRPGQEIYPFYLPSQILPFLGEVQETMLPMEHKKIGILFSGDTGFYSGCQSLYAALKQEIQAGQLKADVRILPGISSIAYLSACIGECYQDGAIYSMHGKQLESLAHRIRYSQKTFLLTSGVQDVRRLGRSLVEAGLERCEVALGYQLSYEEQKITWHTPMECCEMEAEGLYTCFVKNSDAVERALTPGLHDDMFLRGQVPMTKEEIREVIICKLRLCKNAVVYDIGSGTGSIAVEIAALSEDIQVLAIERKKEAISLMEENKKKFQLENITIAELEAPEGLRKLPVATHAFIGGSGGKLKEILAVLREINPRMRVVITAISIETICEIQKALSLYKVTGEEIVQIQVSRAKKAGEYHLMRAENPVWICGFEFEGD